MKQGYNSRLDESLGARNGKKTQSLKDRRDESKGAKKGAGKRAYSSVSTMDKPKKRQVIRTNKDGVKTKQVLKDGVVKKTVTRTKGGVEKEIERGKKRIDVRKYKDEGVKTRKVTDMKKNDQYKADQVMKDFKNMIDNAATSDYMRANQDAKDSIKNSSFARLPYNMVNEALKPENNILPANVLDKIQQKKNQRTINMLNRESEKQRKENQ